jgi:peptidoglycan/xylan/chitin deacetylase (PgdA/CDA1 family)
MKKLIFATLGFFIIPVIHAACPDGKSYEVHFTFDDGPHGVLTPKVLDILKEEKVPSTFFVLGEHFAGGRENPSNKSKYALLDRMKKEGHKIGSHTYKHINHPQYSAAEVRDNIMKTNPLIKEYLSPVLRLPYGGGSFRSSNPAVQAKNDMVMNTIKNAGFKHVGWDIDTNDWDVKKRPGLLQNMLRDICRQKGGVVLFHDVQSFTVENLRSWIRAIKNEGHTFSSLERFVPEALAPLPPEACELDPLPKAKVLKDDLEKVIKKIKD